MKEFVRYSSLAIVLSVCVASRAADLSFDRDIRPILSDKCFHCHGPDDNKRDADLRLDTYEGATADLGGYSAIVPGDTEDSELIYRIFSDDPDEIMPTPKSHLTLTDREKELLKQWVESGAEYEGHWAFSPVTEPSPPVESHPVDHFIQARQQVAGLAANPPATAQALGRRMALDLTGLPLPAERAAVFEQAHAADPQGAVAALLDDLLASPHYGERMAWDWLDVSRYADSNGYQGDRERTMYPWRDWVIEAFQKNLSWDQFTIWQLAGDLLEEPTQEQVLATGFSRNHPINGEGGRIAEENRVDYVYDMTETMGTTWLGLTLECSRCHDHKFDPISQRDYFALNAFFNQTPVTGGGGDPQQRPHLKLPTDHQLERQQALQQQKKEATQRLAELKKSKGSETQAEHSWSLLEPVAAEADHQQLAIESDLSIVASSEKNPAKDTYRVTYRVPEGVAKLGSLKLDALQHASHTPSPQGLARSDSGNFVLTEIEIAVNGKPLKITGASASHEQNGFPVERAFDGKSDTGWAVHRGKPVVNPEHAIFSPRATVPLQAGDTIEVVLRHDSRHPHHNMGRWQLSASPRLNRSEIELTEARIKSIDDTLKRLDSQVVKVMVMEDMAKPRDTFILEGGFYNQPGEKVSAAIPAVFGSLAEEEKPNRLSLAQWLVDGENPLTARVTVNRLWQMFFGTGLVKTSEDFGVQGERPSHPQLLDWLSNEFVSSGWDVQHVIRLIVTSQTYQQSAVIREEHTELDPDNRLLARSPRHRLPSWMLRDQALAASGLLVPTVGGKPVNAYQPEGIWEELSFGKKKYVRGNGDDLYRRTIYTFWRRISAPTMLFDSADRMVCDVLPSRTNTPLQALTLMNDTTYVEAARVAAQQQGDVDALFRAIANRLPSDREKNLLQQRIGALTEHYRAHPADAKALLDVGEYPLPDGADLPSLAARTAVANVIYNLDEIICRP